MSSPEIIAHKLLSDMNYKFYLGGSRRMSQLHPMTVAVTSGTDYDLYATYSDELAQMLDRSGFLEIGDATITQKDGYELDTEVVKMYEHEDVKVQVILRRDAEFYNTVFDAIPASFYVKYLWKSSPTCEDTTLIKPTFNALFAVAHAFHKLDPVSPTSSSGTSFEPTNRDPIKAYEFAMKGAI